MINFFAEALDSAGRKISGKVVEQLQTLVAPKELAMGGNPVAILSATH
jgi:hypothetical protein